MEAIVALVLFIFGSILASPPLVKATWASEMEKRFVQFLLVHDDMAKVSP
jgi:hypothetical protein